MPASRTVSVLLTEVAVASSDCWLVIVKSAVVGRLAWWRLSSWLSASWYAADST